MIKRDNNKRFLRTRWNIKSASGRARLSVYRSNKFIYAQVIDDKEHKTMASAWGKKAEEVGEKIAKKSLAAKITEVVFDRGGYKYHGKVKLLADTARQAGLKF